MTYRALIRELNEMSSWTKSNLDGSKTHVFEPKTTNKIWKLAIIFEELQLPPPTAIANNDGGTLGLYYSKQAKHDMSYVELSIFPHPKHLGIGWIIKEGVFDYDDRGTCFILKNRIKGYIQHLEKSNIPEELKEFILKHFKVKEENENSEENIH